MYIITIRKSGRQDNVNLEPLDEDRPISPAFARSIMSVIIIMLITRNNIKQDIK